MAQRIRVGIVDDHPLFLEGVIGALRQWSGFDVVGGAATADEAVELVRREVPDLLLLDLAIPGGGLKAAGRILSSHPGTGIVVLTSSDDEENVLAALKVGAKGYVLKGVGGGELVRILEQVMAGRIYVSPALTR